MKFPGRHPVLRRGFTLIEMLVVIAIIGILLAILLPAVLGFLSKGPQLLTTNEISQLDQACQDFKTRYNVGYIPSRLKICEKFSEYTITENGAAADNPLDRDSVTFLTTVFNKILTSGAIWSSSGIDWNNDGAYTPPVVLEGDQCLVFVLGGVQVRNPPSCFGWATDLRNPIKPTQTTDRKGPFFQFVGARLNFRPGTQAAQYGYFSYYDPYSASPINLGVDKPYAFFSSYGVPSVGYIKYGLAGDCPSLFVTPYCASTPGPTGQYYNPKTQQIISAGVDRAFGPGGQWTPATAGAIGPGGKDDQSNFSGSLLGVAN